MFFSNNENSSVYAAHILNPHRIVVNLNQITEYELVMNNGKRLQFNLDRSIELGLIQEIKEDK